MKQPTKTTTTTMKVTSVSALAADFSSESMPADSSSSTGSNNRFYVLDYQQIQRLNKVLQSRIPIAPKPSDVVYEDAPFFTNMLNNSINNNNNEEKSGPTFCKKHQASGCSCADNTSPSMSPRDTNAQYETFPVIHVKVCDIIKAVRSSLKEQDIPVKEVRINGGAAGHIIDVKSMQAFSDIDLIFSVDLPDNNAYCKIKTTVLDTMSELLAENSNFGHASYPLEEFTSEIDPMTGQLAMGATQFIHQFCSVQLTPDPFMIKQYIRKMIRVNKPALPESDSWSLISLGYQTPHGGKTIELKFVHRMRRPFEFTVDSFQIVTDSLFHFYEHNIQPISSNVYPAVVAESVAGSFARAMLHLKNRIIATNNPEEIRGGGLLKYCKLLVEGYKPNNEADILSLERYMCSRFFIDFPTVQLQYGKLVSYLADHFSYDEDVKVCYLKILYEVVAHSTVCLMTHERQQTLNLIKNLMEQVLCFATPTVASILSFEGFADQVPVLDVQEDTDNVLNISTFASEAWAVDKIFYGTDQFPMRHFHHHHHHHYHQQKPSSQPHNGKRAGNHSTSSSPNFTANAVRRRKPKHFYQRRSGGSEPEEQRNEEHQTSINPSRAAAELSSTDDFPALSPPEREPPSFIDPASVKNSSPSNGKRKKQVSISISPLINNYSRDFPSLPTPPVIQNGTE